MSEEKPIKFWPDSLEEWVPLIARVVVLVVVALLGVNSQTDKVEGAKLEAEENAASTTEIRAAGDARESVAYEDYYELLRFHDARDAECDSALASFARHRDDDRDWEHVVRMCHSEGGFSE